MIDPRRAAVLIRDEAGQFQDRTPEIDRYELGAADSRVRIVYKNGWAYPYGQARVQIADDPEQGLLSDGAMVEVDGTIWPSAADVVKFTSPNGRWYRIFYPKQGQETYRTYPASRIRMVANAAQAPAAAEILNYWRAVVARLGDEDPLTRPYEKLSFIHPESVLGTYVTGAPIEPRESTTAPIFPFRCNLSQRTAVENGLTRSVSVIEGPPGTGKTETILNLIANVVVRRETVGVVSFNNAAVDNVREKLDALGFGHVIANLGKREKRADFLTAQAARNTQVDEFVSCAPRPPDAERLTELDRRLSRLQEAERTRAQLRHEVDAYRLELQHFERHLRRDELPDLDGLPLLRRSADRILDYLVESEVEHQGTRPGLLRRIQKYFTYGSLRGLDPDDTDVVLGLQRAYYEKQIAELDEQLDRTDDQLRRANLDQVAREHQELSVQALRAELGDRYRGLPRRTYEADYRRRAFTDFLEDYPVLLSTCHSLRDSIADGYLLDYLIIDEASQVHLPLMGLALSCCRNVVVVGDQRQLPPITRDLPADVVPPRPAYDYGRHNILSSLTELYGHDLPRALLREHYRCDPAIIGFCNKKFYDGELIPYTTSGTERPMIVVRTVEGNHMRQRREGGRSNRRELDVIETEVIPAHCPGIPRGEIGVTTPYRLQADLAANLLDQVESDTVHRFQGRQRRVVILTTVLDETRTGRIGLRFLDNPQLINVAVSRAVERFILVIHHGMLPRSRHIHDLVGYIRYHDLDEGIVDSSVMSMFDLLYKEYSKRLRPLAARLRNDLKFRSENIAWTVLHDILAEEKYQHLTIGSQVLLRNLLVDGSGLTPRQAEFVRHRASVDFVVYNRVTNEPRLAIEVDGFEYHENNPAQLVRDKLKDDILKAHKLRLLRLPTTGSREDEQIRRVLDEIEDQWPDDEA